MHLHESWIAIGTHHQVGMHQPPVMLTLWLQKIFSLPVEEPCRYWMQRLFPSFVGSHFQ